MKQLLAVAALVFHTPLWAHSAVQDYKVADVPDGQTLKVAGKRSRMTCRLYGIVAPEREQAFAEASRASLSDLAHGREVHVHVIHTIGPGVFGCRVFAGGKEMSHLQVGRGMARKDRSHTADAKMLRAEADAKARGLGLWSEPEAAASDR